MLDHQLSRLLSHHWRLLYHHLSWLLTHHWRLLDHHLPWLRLLLLWNHLPHDLALHHLHLLARRPHLHARTNWPHEPAGHHLHGLALDWGPHAGHVGLRRSLSVLGRHVAGARGHRVYGRHGGRRGVWRAAQRARAEWVLIVYPWRGHVRLGRLAGEA